jgi:putative SOS response-associated peptidase YedK
MCGRFALTASPEAIAEYLDSAPPDPYAPRYNIAPTQPVLSRTRQALTHLRWGLVPSWARDPSMGSRMINARSETVAEKPSFRNAFRRRRCLIPASGFYEWKRLGDRKQPCYCHLDQPLFCFAGIWEPWQDGDGNELRSCALLTAPAEGPMSDIHDRMPVVLNDALRSLWMDHHDENTARAEACIAERVRDFQIHPVSTRVNSPSHEGPDLIRPLAQGCR